MSSPVRPATTYPTIVGRVLANLRTQAGLEQNQLALKLGLSQSAWSRIERGGTALTIEQLASVAALLHKTPSEVLAIADRSVEMARAQGIKVMTNRQPDDTAGLAWIAAATLAIIVGTALLGGKK